MPLTQCMPTMSPSVPESNRPVSSNTTHVPSASVSSRQISLPVLVFQIRVVPSALAGDKAFGVGGKGDRKDCIGVSLEYADRLASSQFLQPDGSVAAPGGKHFAIARQGEAINGVGMAFERANVLTRLCIPCFGRTVKAGR